MTSPHEQLTFSLLAGFVITWVLLLLPAILVRYVIVRSALSEAEQRG